MEIIPPLSHMPFADGENLVFCKSDGAESFVQPMTEFEMSRGMNARTTPYQPWRMAVRRNGLIYDINTGMPTDTPMRIFCTPVLLENQLSFIYARSLYSARMDREEITDITMVREGVFTGFKTQAVIVSNDPKDGSSFTVEKDGEHTRVRLATTSILRLVPNEDSIIATVAFGGGFISVLLTNGRALRITANGEDVYKCCLRGKKVIHAKRIAGFEERSIHEDDATLTEMEGFILA